MLKVVVCDDEYPMREYLKSLTEQCTGSQVSVFENGEELLKDKTRFDVILLDISLNQHIEFILYRSENKYRYR